MSNSVFCINKILNIDSILKKVSKYDWVSFDVFDTLIKRNCYNPQSLFKILDNVAMDMKIESFKNIRINTEADLRRKASFITLEDIYKEIGKKIGHDNSCYLMEKEIEIELSYCQTNFEVMELYKKILEMDKKIIAISDMYLSSKIIKKMLKKCGYSIENVYVSCECNAKKSDSTLFGRVLKLEKIDKKSIIHIGDDPRADYFGAKLAGFDSILVKHSLKRYNDSKFINKLDNKDNYLMFKSVIDNNLEAMSDYYSKFGFAVLGPLVYNYLVWLKNKCIENNVKKIFFFSRDG